MAEGYQNVGTIVQRKSSHSAVVAGVASGILSGSAWKTLFNSNSPFLPDNARVLMCVSVAATVAFNGGAAASFPVGIHELTTQDMSKVNVASGTVVFVFEW